MIASTKGISLHYYKYSESSIIAKILTKKFGIQSYLIKGIRNKKSKQKLNLLQPLTLLKLEVNHNKKRGIQFIREMRNDNPIKNNMPSMNKRFVSVFISEILLKILTRQEEDLPMFMFIWESVIKLNYAKKTEKCFPLIFLFSLTKYLGFYPSLKNPECKFFNLENGGFSNKSGNHSISGSLKSHFFLLSLEKEFEITYKERSDLLKTLMLYYTLHHYNLQSIKSHEIIESLRV